MPRIHDTKPAKERALLVGVHHPKTPYPVEDCLEELALLADTAGVEVVTILKQNIRQIDAGTFIGKGKVSELAAAVRTYAIQIVIFDDDLSPAQTKNLEKAASCRVIDRSALILDIFARRAKTREARTQVELAQLQYLLPRLTRQWTHLERQAGGGVFTKGPGETQLETDRRLIGKRISLLKEELKKIENHRKTQRAARGDTFQVALVGYTNAGKSTMLNTLSDAGVYVEDRLFATLDATSRRVFLDKEQVCIVTDTVGFIRKLPHDLVASFRSTLEEAREADILVHVVDIANHLYLEQMDVVQSVLEDLGAKDKTMLLVFNKVDRVTDESTLVEARRRHPDALFVSAIRQIGLDRLIQRLKEEIEQAYVIDSVTIDHADGKLYSMVHYLAEVLESRELKSAVRIVFRARKANAEKIRAMQSARKDYAKTIG